MLQKSQRGKINRIWNCRANIKDEAPQIWNGKICKCGERRKRKQELSGQGNKPRMTEYDVPEYS